MITNEQLKQIKRINRRLAQMEESGYKDTQLYTDLLMRVENSGINTRVDKNGNIRLSQSLNQEATGIYDVDTNLNWIERVQTLKQAQKRFRQELKNSPELKEFFKGDFSTMFRQSLNLKMNLQQAIDDYEAMEISVTSRKFHQFATQGKLRRMSYEEIDEYLRSIEREKQEAYEEMENKLRENDGFSPFDRNYFED